MQVPRWTLVVQYKKILEDRCVSISSTAQLRFSQRNGRSVETEEPLFRLKVVARVRSK